MTEIKPDLTHDECTDPVIIAALDYMGKNLQQDLSLDDIARHVNLSTTRFKHRFKTVTGFTPKRKLRTLRVERAEEILLGSDLQVKQIAAEAGFPVVGTFVRNFRAVRGISPGRWRYEQGTGWGTRDEEGTVFVAGGRAWVAELGKGAG
jgi:AraC family transcriptional regulator